MRSRFVRLVAVLTVPTLLLGACGGGAESVAPAAYARDMCTSVNDWVSAIQARAAGLGEELTGEAAQAKERLDEFFGVAIDATETLIGELEDAGVPDVDGGEETAEELIETFKQAKAALEDAQDKVADLPEDDPAAFGEESRALGAEIQSAMGDLGSAMQQAPDELTEATLDEPACQQLNEGGS